MQDYIVTMPEYWRILAHIASAEGDNSIIVIAGVALRSTNHSSVCLAAIEQADPM